MRTHSTSSLLVDRPVLHHQLYAANRGDVFGWVALHRDQISKITVLNLAQLVAHAEHLGVNRGSGAKRSERCHSVSNQHFDFTRVVAVSEHADIAAIADRHARIERGFEAFFLGDYRGRIGVDALLPATVL